MSDTALARNLIAEIGQHCWRGKGDMLDRVYDAIRSFNPRTEISRRRVRAFWHGEAALVKFHEMTELAEVAELEQARQADLQEARRDHAEFVARTARLATALAVQDEVFHREAIAAFGRIQSCENDRSVERVAGGSADAASGGRGACGMVG